MAQYSDLIVMEEDVYIQSMVNVISMKITCESMVEWSTAAFHKNLTVNNQNTDQYDFYQLFKKIAKRFKDETHGKLFSKSYGNKKQKTIIGDIDQNKIAK